MENAKDVAELLFIGMDNKRHGDKNVVVGQDSLRCFLVCWNKYLSLLILRLRRTTSRASN